MGNNLSRYRQLTPVNQNLGAGNGSNKVLLFQGQLTNLVGNNPELIASGAKLLYSAKFLNLTVSWHIQSGRSLDAFLRPDGLISPQTIDNIQFARLLTFWIAPPRKAPFKFHELLLIKNEGYRFQQVDLLMRVGAIPLGEDTKFFVSVENTGGGPLTSADSIIVQGEIEESVEVVRSSSEDLSAQLAAIEAKLDTLQTTSPGTGDSTTINMTAPIGSIIAWHKSLNSSVTRPPEWVECNGQVLSDPESPYDGMTIPNLNGENRFLRGGTNSGTLQDDALQGHWHDAVQLDGAGISTGGGSGYHGVKARNTPQIGRNDLWGAGNPTADATNGTVRIANETRPKNMAVVWLMKVK